MTTLGLERGKPDRGRMHVTKNNWFVNAILALGSRITHEHLDDERRLELLPGHIVRPNKQRIYAV